LKDEIFFRVFADLPRLGPGSSRCTCRAFRSISAHLNHPLILDAGCGSGSSTRLLARHVDGIIIALDIHLPLLKELVHRSREAGVSAQITPVAASMDTLPFKQGIFDLIWCECALYTIGFEHGLAYFWHYLRDGGFIVVSEFGWRSSNPPEEARRFWEGEYPAMQTERKNRAIIAQTGYRLIECFMLPESAWWDEYYRPLRDRVNEVRIMHAADPGAGGILDAIEREISIFERYGASFGYFMYILQKPDEDPVESQLEQGCFHRIFRSPGSF
jgi:SAM-dependent methyltransferase